MPQFAHRFECGLCGSIVLIIFDNGQNIQRKSLGTFHSFRVGSIKFQPFLLISCDSCRGVRKGMWLRSGDEKKRGFLDLSLVGGSKEGVVGATKGL